MTVQWGAVVRLAGRSREKDLLHRAMEGAVGGTPCTVLVHGEPGVGKTRLVTAVTEPARLAGHPVLWGRCLRFGAASTPYLPFVSAFEGWLADGNPADAIDLEALYGGPRDGELMPHALRVVDRALARLAEESPVVLVVDDLQWADASSLDTLAYLVAGMRRQRLAILVTYRDPGVPDGDPLHSWVADVLRLPGVVDLPLGRLSLDETAEQLELLRGEPPRPSLVREVWDRSEGNAYLTELLVRDLDPATETLPEDLPVGLRTALLAQWHGLDPDARRTAQVLAVAGRPVDPEVLTRVLPDLDVDAALHRAAEVGVVQADRGGAVWFRHPLLAEVLDGTLLPDEVRALHRSFVDVLLAAAETGRSSHHLGDLALHYEGAGMVDDAFEAYLAAAKEALRARAHREATFMLQQAGGLWHEVDAQVRERHGSLPALLTETARVARLAGDLDAALEALDRAGRTVDPDAEPLVAARAIRMRAEIGYSAGLTANIPVERMRDAVALASRVPGSEELAFCLADLADSELWSGDREAGERHAREAVAVAEQVGDAAARSFALGPLVFARVDEDDAESLARQAAELARESGRLEFVGLAAIALANVLEVRGRSSDAADALRDAAERCRGYNLQPLLGTYAATFMLPLGRLEEAREILRDVLASRPHGILGIQARGAAMVVAVRTGDLPEAEWHLERLRELAPSFEQHVGLHGPGDLAELLLAQARPREALDLLERTIELHSASEPKYGDSLLVWAARAAAALPPSQRRPALERIEAARARSPVPAFEGGDRDPGQRAVAALYAAESARALGDGDVLALWREAVARADEADLRHAATEARLRLAETLLAGRHRREAATLLREAHTRARRMGAGRLAEEISTVAATARLALDEPVVPPQGGTNGHGLTAREREVLAHLVAGRSYAEIAEALVISEKTVSVHVSNLLRKTGTTSRVEAAAWARRSGALTG